MPSDIQFIPITEWFEEKLLKPLIISGPCSAESEDQVLKTAEILAKDHRI